MHCSWLHNAAEIKGVTNLTQGYSDAAEWQAAPLAPLALLRACSEPVHVLKLFCRHPPLCYKSLNSATEFTEICVCGFLGFARIPKVEALEPIGFESPCAADWALAVILFLSCSGDNPMYLLNLRGCYSFNPFSGQYSCLLFGGISQII